MPTLARMQDLLAIRDVQLFIACIVLALVIAWLSSPRQATDVPVWPTRLYLLIIDMTNLPGIGEYSKSRRVFSRREQFLTTFFVWFFILFVASVFAFGCSGRRGC